MIGQHPSFPQPENLGVKLWRYMDAPRFLALLQTQKLHFARADLLGDPFEGSATRRMVEELRQAIEKHPSDELPEDVFGSKTKKGALGFLDQWANIRRFQLNKMFVSCWHTSEYESAAMWRLYSESPDAIAIQTTYNLLAEELPEEVNLGEVRYLDYERDVLPDANVFTAFTCKRKSFEHEREVRAIVWSMDANLEGPRSKDGRIEIQERGATVDVDLGRVIQRVFVSPTSKPWFADVIRSAMAKYGLAAELHHSDLNREPVY